MKKEKINFNYDLKVYWSFLRNYKWLFLAVLLLVLISEGASVSEKFLFKIIVDSGTSLEAGSILASAFVNVAIIIALVFVGVTITRAVAQWLQLHVINNLEVKLIRIEFTVK